VSRDGRLVWGLAALGVAALVVVAFQPALSAQFLSFDDPENLTRNHAFRGLGAAQLEWLARTGHMGHYQPLSWLSLALDHARGGGLADGTLDPAPFHATNVALHALGALCVGLFARELLGARALVGAMVAALVFGVHPMRVESVAWVTERRDVLSAPFLVLCLWAWVRRGAVAPPVGARAWGGAALALAAVGLCLGALDLSQPGRIGLGGAGAAGLAAALAAWVASVALFARGPGRGAYALAALCLLFSLAAKAWGIVVPALLLVLDAWPLARMRERRAVLPLLLEKAPFVALALVFGRLASWAQASQVATMKSLEEHGLLERAAQGVYGLCYYVWRHVVPSRLSPIYELPETLSFADPRFLLPLFAVVAAGLALFALRRRAPWAVAAALAYAAILAPVLGVLQSGPQLVADRYGYLASIPLALLLGALAHTLVQRPRARPFALAGAALLLAAATLATRAQARLWTSSERLWEHAVAVQPDSALARLSLGSVRLEASGRATDPAQRRALLDEARAEFERGLALRREPRLVANLALVEGSLAELEPERAAEHRARALEYSAESLRLAEARGGVELELRLNHATHLFNAGRTAEALPLFESVARLRPRQVGARERYGIALLAASRLDEAQAEFEAVLALEPGHAGARRWLREVERVRAAGR
jgi:tetratricopeptide (TPR) repeat protein